MGDNYVSAARSIDLTSFSRRIMYISVTARLLYNGTASEGGYTGSSGNHSYKAYEVEYADLKYFRIKNLDETNNLEVGIVNSHHAASADSLTLRVFPGEIMTIYEGENFYMVDENNIPTTIVGDPSYDINFISCKSSSGTIIADLFLGYDQS